MVPDPHVFHLCCERTIRIGIQGESQIAFIPRFSKYLFNHPSHALKVTTLPVCLEGRPLDARRCLYFHLQIGLP